MVEFHLIYWGKLTKILYSLKPGGYNKKRINYRRSYVREKVNKQRHKHRMKYVPSSKYKQLSIILNKQTYHLS